jgi:hypothetical protein
MGCERTKDDDEYLEKARLFWVRHEHLFERNSKQNHEFRN